MKWSGLYVLAAFGLYVVVTDALARRRAGVILWPSAAAFRQGPVSFVLLVFPALATYLVSWTGWFVTAGGYDRDSDAEPPGRALELPPVDPRTSTSVSNQAATPTRARPGSGRSCCARPPCGSAAIPDRAASTTASP